MYLVNEYFQNKEFAKNQRETHRGSESKQSVDSLPTRDNLPEHPTLFIQDNEGRYVQAIHGNYELLGKDVEADIRIWCEEFIYDDEGDCLEIKTTYPDGETDSIYIHYDANKEVTEIK